MINNPFFPFSDLVTKHELPDALFTILTSKKQAASITQLSGESLMLVYKHTGSSSDSHALKLNGWNHSFHVRQESRPKTQLMSANLTVSKEKSFVESSE